MPTRIPWIKKHVPLLIYAFSVIAITLYSYQKLPQLYYLNDEWLSLAGVYVNGIMSGISNYSIPELLTGKGRPLGTLLINTYYLFFPYNMMPFAITSYVFHIINSVLTYIVIRKLSKSEFIAFFSGIFFVTASAFHQAFSWTANVTQVPTSTAFLLLSLWSMITYVEKKEHRYFILSWLCGYVAFLFKDAVFYIFIVLPLFQYLLSASKNNAWKIYKDNLVLAIPILLLGLYRIISMYGQNIISVSSGATKTFWLQVLFNSIFYPIISFSQTFVPQRFMYNVAEAFLRFNYPQLIPYISNIGVLSENIISDAIFTSASLFFLLLVVVAYTIQRKQRRTIRIALVVYVLSFIPVDIYLFPRGVSYIESRYVYFSTILVGLIVGIVLDAFRNMVGNKKCVAITTIGIVLFSGLYFYKQITLIRKEVNKSLLDGQNTKSVLAEFSRVMPHIPPKTVIYLTGNASYYSYQHHPVPLQLDPGYIIMVWYYKSGTIPKGSLPVDKNHWKFGSQWYEESGEAGFGYYWDKDSLAKGIREGKFSASQVIGLYYDGNTKTLHRQ